jgi:transposase-like protein
MRGEVVADETFIGGSVSLSHQQGRHGKPVYGPGGSGRAPSDKTAVLSLIDRGTGEVRSRVVPDVTGATLRKVIAENVDMPNTILFSDEGRGYVTFEHEFAAHKTVNHSDDEYVRYEADGIVTSNDAENFFSQLKRFIDGTHHHVSATDCPATCRSSTSATPLAR